MKAIKSLAASFLVGYIMVIFYLIGLIGLVLEAVWFYVGMFLICILLFGLKFTFMMMFIFKALRSKE